MGLGNYEYRASLQVLGYVRLSRVRLLQRRVQQGLGFAIQGLGLGLSCLRSLSRRYIPSAFEVRCVF